MDTNSSLLRPGLSERATLLKASLRRAATNAGLLALHKWNSFLRLIGCRRRYYAEFFTDRFLRNTFFPDFEAPGVLVEVGCATPELISISKHFRENEWRCIGIEPNPNFVKLCRQAGAEVYEYAAAEFEADDHPFVVVEASSTYSDTALSAHSYSSLKIKDDYLSYNGADLARRPRRHISVKVRRLETILACHCPEVSNVDILSIDVEGYELEVLRGFNLAKYSTKVVVLENLFHLPTYSEYMDSIGYRLYTALRYNYIYVSKEFSEVIESHKSPGTKGSQSAWRRRRTLKSA